MRKSGVSLQEIQNLFQALEQSKVNNDMQIIIDNSMCKELRLLYENFYNYIQLLENRINKVKDDAEVKIKTYKEYINCLTNGNFPSPTIRQERQELIYRIKEQEELLKNLESEE